MKVIIAGSREITNLKYVKLAILKSKFQISEIVSGMARGVDKLGEIWAIKNGIPIKRFPADWDKFGKSAGYIRNEQMGQYADALIAIWDGSSLGTKNMINITKKRKIPVYVYIIKKEECLINFIK